MEMETKYQLSPRIRYRDVMGEGVIVNLDTGRIVVINEVGLAIVGLLKESPMSQSSIVAKVVEEFDTTVDDARPDIANFVEELALENIIGAVTD